MSSNAYTLEYQINGSENIWGGGWKWLKIIKIGGSNNVEEEAGQIENSPLIFLFWFDLRN